MENKEQSEEFNKQELSVISDAEYIRELEGLVCFLSGCYEKAKNTYHDKHLETCSRANPNRRDLTECEQNEWQRFPLIQGTKLQHVILDISQSKKPTPENIDGFLKRFINK